MASFRERFEEVEKTFDLSRALPVIQNVQLEAAGIHGDFVPTKVKIKIIDSLSYATSTPGLSGAAVLDVAWQDIPSIEYWKWQRLVPALASVLPGFELTHPNRHGFNVTLHRSISIAYLIGPVYLRPDFSLMPQTSRRWTTGELLAFLSTMIPSEFFDMPATNVIVQTVTGAIRFLWGYLSQGRSCWGKYMIPSEPFPSSPATPQPRAAPSNDQQQSARYDGIPPVYASAPDGRLLGLPSAPTDSSKDRQTASRNSLTTQTSPTAPTKYDSSDDDDSSLSSWDDDDFLAKALGKYEEPIEKTTAIVKPSSAKSTPAATSSKRKGHVDSDSDDDQARPEKRSKVAKKASSSSTNIQPTPKASTATHSSSTQHGISQTSTRSRPSASTKGKKTVSRSSHSSGNVTSAADSDAQLPVRPKVGAEPLRGDDHAEQDDDMYGREELRLERKKKKNRRGGKRLNKHADQDKDISAGLEARIERPQEVDPAQFTQGLERVSNSSDDGASVERLAESRPLEDRIEKPATTGSKPSGTTSIAPAQQTTTPPTIDLTLSPSIKSETREESTAARVEDAVPSSASQATSSPKLKTQRVMRTKVLDRLKQTEQEEKEELRADLKKMRNKRDKLQKSDGIVRSILQSQSRYLTAEDIEEMVVRVEEGSTPDNAYKAVKAMAQLRARTQG
ncbi:uncharacterized protein AB675_1215 [Cyphellophora attinorum]|uniref:Uncharacterized protein n=1 Tax=Cyphellophora attinorum TaxID=1664694 RepID=A0A0N0NII1_9EURO|nr:uncharacterized protein AB675_1215 [Phialophora attinorum]KPI35768.1 hypothetical protein AB675_1215 [Phialophora attinorum]